MDRPLVISPNLLRVFLRALGVLAVAFLGIAMILKVSAVKAVPAGAVADVQDEPVQPRVKAAVDKALEWLAKNQQPDGNWSHGNQGGTTAVPSLAVMAFLARGHVPGQGPYGEVLNKAIDYVLSCQNADGPKKGLLAGEDGNSVMYEHGISTVMLSEVAGMVDDARRDRIDSAISLAAQLIIDAQRPNGNQKDENARGGWRYSPQSADSDISCTGWQLMALRGAANCGAVVPRSVLDDGLAYVKRCGVASGGFSYQAHSGGANQARTGTGILSTILIGGDKNAPEVQKAGDFLMQNPPLQNVEFYFYAVYYDSQALNQLGGKYWQQVYPKLVDHLLTHQQPDGTFRGGGSQEDNAGSAYCTSMSVLALCVPFRYLPLYQADK
jgi:prenyltransferase beta subunit